MLGAGVNKANLSAIKNDLEIADLGEGLLRTGLGEERKEPDYIEALQFTETKPKKSKNKAMVSDDETLEEQKEINFENTM